MKTKKKICMAGRYFVLAVGLVITLSAYASQSSGMTLDEAIAKAAAQMNERLPARTKVALISVNSPSEAFSGYVLEGLEAALLESGKLVVVDRTNIDKVRATYDGFQLSGEVNDASAKYIGQMVGAGAIVTGSLTNIGTLYRLTLKAIDVEKAVVAVSSPADITNDERVQALLGQSGSATVPASQSGGSGGAQVPVQPTAPVPNPVPDPGLYVNDAFQGAMNLMDAIDWITLNAQNGRDYTILLGSDQVISNVILDCGGKQVTITLKASGGERKVSFASRNPSYALFTVKAGVTFTIENEVTLSGLQSASQTIVEIDGGKLVMNGGAIKDSKTNDSGQAGQGVFIRGGSFTMNGGTISGNTNGSGGGVYVHSGLFTMNDGTISGNTSNSGGGGVYVNSGGRFIMSGGTISRNTSGNAGGGVVVAGMFTMSGGTISGNNTKYSTGGGGGVRVGNGTFTMSNGTISGNTCEGRGGGGGVLVGDRFFGGGGTFTMSGGTISGNTTGSDGGGGGVAVCGSGTFTKSGKGGVIYGSDSPEEANSARSKGHAVETPNGIRDTTVRLTKALDSTKKGAEGGWE